MTAIIILILGIWLTVEYEDRTYVIIIRARFASYRHQLKTILAASHQRRSLIRCLRCGSRSRSYEKTADFPR